MMKIVNKPPITIFVLVIGLYCSGCDGVLRMEGRVYEWGNATPSDKSFVVIDNFQTLIPAKLIPLKDANIKIEPWEPKERRDISYPSLWCFVTLSIDEGDFILTLVELLTLVQIGQPSQWI
ncbi:MAG: hypothetical protein ACQ9IQ_04660 [Nitrospirales bacterium]